MQLFCLFLLIFASFFLPVTWAEGEIQPFTKIGQDGIRFADPRLPFLKLKTPVFQLQYWSTLWDVARKNPYFLFSGTACATCSEKQLYLFRSSGDLLSFVFPGTILEKESHQILLESRFFYGRCLKNTASRSDAMNRDWVVIFQRERVDRRFQLQSSVFLGEPGPDYLLEDLRTQNLPRLKDTLELVKQKRCFEVVGHRRVMLATPSFTDRLLIEQQRRREERNASTIH